MSVRGWNPFLRYPRISLVVVGLLSLPLLVPLARFGVSAEMRALLAGDGRNLASFDRLREILGETEVVAVSLELPDLFSPAGLGVVQAVSDALAQLPGVTEVKSLTHSVRPVRRGWGFRMIPMVPPGPWEESALAELKEFCLTHPLVRHVLVSGDGRHTLVTAHLAKCEPTPAAQGRFRRQIEAVLAPFREAGVSFRVLALPLIEDEIRGTLRRDLVRFLPAAFGVVVGVLWWTYRSWRGVVFTLANQAAVLLLLPGIAWWAGWEWTVFSLLIVPLVTGLHLTLLMHLLTAYQRAVGEGHERGAALERALEVVVQPAWLATLTTGFGLLSLGVSGIPQVREFGWLGAACLLFMHGFTFGPGLALFRLLVCPREWRASSRVRTEVSGGDMAGERAGAVSDLAERWLRWAGRARGWILVAAGLAVGVGVVGVLLVRTDVRIIEMLGRSSPTRQALEEVDRAYGGINMVSIAFDSGRTNGLNDLAFLRYLDRVHRYAAGRPEPSGVFSYAQVLGLIHQIWEGGSAEAMRLPESDWMVTLFSAALRAYRFPVAAGLADPELRVAQLVVRTRDLPAAEYLRLIREVVAFAEGERPAGVTVSAAEGLHSILEADRRMLRSQWQSVGGVLVMIGLCLAVFWRSVGLALLALGVGLVPVGLALATAGYAGVPLNSVNVMVGALALGIAQDDIVHFLTYWRRLRRAGRSAEEAWLLTLRMKGRPILWTSVILVAVFGLFGLSAFPPVVQFGMLLAGALVAAQVSLWVLLTTLLLPGEPRPRGQSSLLTLQCKK